MKKLTIAFLSVALSMPLPAKDKGPIITVQVLGTDAWTRAVTIHHAGTQGSSNSHCSTTGSVSDPGGTGTASIDADTNCTTTSTPGRAPYTTTRNIQQETVHALLPDGRQVTLWCQKGWRDCRNLAEGSYKAQIEGRAVIWIFVLQLDNSEKRIKYRLQ